MKKSYGVSNNVNSEGISALENWSWLIGRLKFSDFHIIFLFVFLVIAGLVTWVFKDEEGSDISLDKMRSVSWTVTSSRLSQTMVWISDGVERSWTLFDESEIEWEYF